MKKAIPFIIALLLILVLFVLLGVVSKVQTVETRIKVAATAEECWNVYNDVEKMDKWVPGFKSIETTSGIKNEVGSKNRLVVFDEQGGETKMDQELLTFKPYEKHQINYTSEYIDGTFLTTFEEANDSTIIVSSNQYSGKSVVMRSIFHFMNGKIQTAVDEQYQNLAKEIEKTYPREMVEENVPLKLDDPPLDSIQQ